MTTIKRAIIQTSPDIRKKALRTTPKEGVASVNELSDEVYQYRHEPINREIAILII